MIDKQATVICVYFEVSKNQKSST